MMAPLPLTGRRIAVTRQADQAQPFCRRLEELDATPVRFPTIDFAPLASPALTQALTELDAYRWIVLTSPNAVRFFLARLQTAGLDLQALGRSVRLAATGPATAAALQAAGATVTFVPQAFTGEALAISLPDVASKRILIPRTEQGRPNLAEGLTARGAQVDDIAIYRTVIGRPTAAQYADLAQGVDALTFTSPLTVVNFVQLADLSAVRSAVVACIGPSTAQAAEEQGLTPDIVPGEYTAAGLLDSICDHFREG